MYERYLYNKYSKKVVKDFCQTFGMHVITGCKGKMVLLRESGSAKGNFR